MKTLTTSLIVKSLIIVPFLLLGAHVIYAQTALDDYLSEGLESNLVLQQKQLSLEHAEQALQIARSYFYPSVNLLSDYVSGEGGRSISVPVGDLLNPVYASLNQLTQSDAFPQIENVEQNFFPKNYYDVRTHATLPIINSDLYFNRSIKDQQVHMEEYGLMAYKRDLVFNIKSAYYKYMSAVAAVKVYESATTLVNKNLDVSESLLKNGRGLPATVLRSKSEVERVKAGLNSARNDADNARKHFNFLLNRDLDSDIEINFPVADEVLADSLTMLSVDTGDREELDMLKTAREINVETLHMNRFSRLPKVNAFMDLGSQAEDWAWNSNSLYYLVGVQMSIPLFTGFRNSLNIRQSTLEIKKTELNLQNRRGQLQVAAEVARNNVETSVRNLSAAREQLRSAQSYFNLVEKGYQEGVNSQIEFLDARNQLTTSQLQRNLRWLELLVAQARLERETASYQFK